MHDTSRPRMRVIAKACKACGASVPFRVWRGFRAIAQHLASPCPGCHCVSVLQGPDSWHRSVLAAARHPLDRAKSAPAEQ